jgi:hypothetical protein
MTEETRTFWRAPSGRGKLHLRPGCRKGLVPVELTAAEWEEHLDSWTPAWPNPDTVCEKCAWAMPTIPRVERTWRWPA